MIEEIKVGDWVRLKSPESVNTTPYMVVKSCDSHGATVLWFIENHDLSEKYLPLKLLEIIPMEEWT